MSNISDNLQNAEKIAPGHQAENSDSVQVEVNQRSNSVYLDFTNQAQTEELQADQQPQQHIQGPKVQMEQEPGHSSNFQSFVDDGEVISKTRPPGQQPSGNMINSGAFNISSNISNRQSRSNSKENKASFKKTAKSNRMSSFNEAMTKSQQSELTPKNSRILYQSQQNRDLIHNSKMLGSGSQPQNLSSPNNIDNDEDFFDIPDQDFEPNQATQQIQLPAQNTLEINLNNAPQIESKPADAPKYTVEDAKKLLYLTQRNVENGPKYSAALEYNRITQKKKNYWNKQADNQIDIQSSLNITMTLYHLLSKQQLRFVIWFNYFLTLLLRMFFLFFLGFLIYKMKSQFQNQYFIYLFPIIGLFLLPRILYTGCVWMILLYYEESPDNQDRQISIIFNSVFRGKDQINQHVQAFQLRYNEIDKPKRPKSYYTRRLWYSLVFVEFCSVALPYHKNRYIIFLLSNYIYQCIEITICGPILAIFCVVNRFFTLQADIYTITLGLLLIDYLWVFFFSLFIYCRGRWILKNDKFNRKQLMKLLTH